MAVCDAHVKCGSSQFTLEGWLRGTGRPMSFAVPRVWGEPKNYYDDCYFCMIEKKFTKK